MTPYHAIKRALPLLNADATVVVIGENWAALGAFGGGLGFDGGMAEYMLVPSARLLVPLGSLRWSKQWSGYPAIPKKQGGTIYGQK